MCLRHHALNQKLASSFWRANKEDPEVKRKKPGVTSGLAADISNVCPLSELLLFEVDGLIFVMGNGGSDLGWCSAKFGLLVNEEALFGAS
jgi:hypothetical protein